MRTTTLLFIIVTSLAAQPADASEPALPEIGRISYSARSDGQGLVVRLHASAMIAAVSDPRAFGAYGLRVTVFNTGLANNPILDPPTGPVHSYRIVQEGNNVVLELEMAMDGVIPSTYRDHSSNDILVNLATGNARPRISLPLKTAQDPTPRTAERWQIDTIVIDAGHGGQDTGATLGNVREKDVVLAVANKLGQYLREKENVNVVFTRSDDRFIELSKRGRIANEAGGKLFISIHANASRDRRARGTETYLLGMHRTDSARVVMERENEVIRFESDRSPYDRYDKTSAIQNQLAQSAFMRHSEHLAGLIEDQFKERVGRRSRGVKQAGFYVLYGASMPAVLVELGFITNAGEAAFLASKDGQTYMASAIFRAVRDFKNEYEKALQMATR